MCEEIVRFSNPDAIANSSSKASEPEKVTNEESAFHQKMTPYILASHDYEDPNNLFPKKDNMRKLLRTCSRCFILHDINSPSGRCSYHKSFFGVTIAQAHMGLVIGRGGSFLKEIRERSKVSKLTIPKHEVKRSVMGEIHLHGKGKDVAEAFAMIKKKLKGRQAGSWDCCGQEGAKAKGCEEELVHDSMVRQGFLDKSMVVSTRKRNWSAKVFAVDCEMVKTSRGKELAWVTMLDWKGDPYFDTLVKPQADIVDYNTAYSGITPEMLQGVTTTLSDVQQSILGRLSSNDILIGHSIDSDLRSLHLEHRKVTIKLDLSRKLSTGVVWVHHVWAQFYFDPKRMFANFLLNVH